MLKPLLEKQRQAKLSPSVQRPKVGGSAHFRSLMAQMQQNSQAKTAEKDRAVSEKSNFLKQFGSINAGAIQQMLGQRAPAFPGRGLSEMSLPS